MLKHGRAKLVPLKTKPEEQTLETSEEVSLAEQQQEPVLAELEMEIECPRCNRLMDLHSSFNELVYSCENCSFLLKYV